MLTDIHHMTINVRSIEQALHRYTAFGLVCQRRTSHDAWVHTPNGLIHLHVPDQPIQNTRSIFDSGYTHCCLQTPSISAFMNTIAHTDALPRSAPVDLGTGHWYAYLDDSDGIVTECEGVPYAPTNRSPWLAHIALATPNLERLRTFYAAVTGGSVRVSPMLADNPGIDAIAQHPGIRAQASWIRGLNLTIELWEFHTPRTRLLPPRQPTELGYASVCFSCTDVLSTQQLLIQAGAICDDADPHGTRWYDPDGNCIALVDAQTKRELGLAAPTEPELLTQIESLWRPMTTGTEDV
ncbi:MAG: hypothetical protein RLY87_1112 [Chloroflexota bacterium]